MRESNPYILEPFMKVEIEVPTEFQGPVAGDISARRGYITDTEVKSLVTVITADVPLASMFGYSCATAHDQCGPTEDIPQLQVRST